MVNCFSMKKVVPIVVAALLCVGSYIFLSPQARADESESASLREIVAVNGDDLSSVSIEGMAAAIDKLIEDDPNLALSSNPYDYIRDGRNEYYNSIVSLGVKVLPRLEAILNESSNNGLEEYLIALAIEDIAGTNTQAILKDDPLPMTAKEFAQSWEDIKSSAPQEIEELVSSEGLSAEEKLAALDSYGVLAVSQLNALYENGELPADLVAAMASDADKWSISEDAIEPTQK